MKSHDSLGRRMRYSGRHPTGRTMRVNSTIMPVFQAIDIHGPMSTPNLFKFFPGKNYNNFQHRLTDLYNEASVHGGPYLDRPVRDKKRFVSDAREVIFDTSPHIYDLAPAGIELMKSLRPEHRAPRSDPLLHRMFTACITASIHLAAQEAGHTFLSANEILSHEKVPQKTRDRWNPLSIPVDPEPQDPYALSIPVEPHSITPDALFGIRYADGKLRLFVLECDRGTEAITRTETKHNTFANKLDLYGKVFERGLHEDHFGFRTLMVLTVTTSEQRIESMMEHLPRRTKPFLFKAKSVLGRFWEVPTVMPDLFTEPWIRDGGEFDISRS
jgi:hypothetical protein